MDWALIVSVVAGPLVLYWATQGIFGLVKARQARVAELAADEAEAEKDEKADDRTRAKWAEKRVRIFDDYAHELRGQISELGAVPKPWPEALKTKD